MFLSGSVFAFLLFSISMLCLYGHAYVMSVYDVYVHTYIHVYMMHVYAYTSWIYACM